MPSNIKHNSVRGLRFRCRNDEYYDFMLYRGECSGDGSFGKCAIAGINANDANLQLGKPIYREDKNGKPTMVGGEVESNTLWEGAYNDGVALKDIGLTGIDNGFISYRRDLISNKEFVEMYTGTTYNVPEMKAFYMSPVSGNTTGFKYPMTFEEDKQGKYFSMRGGFFQGFFKLHGFDYQTLPTHITEDWDLQFVLRRRSDYDVQVNTLNNLHPENKGMFFYMGTRAENKFWSKYNKAQDMAEFLVPSVFNDGYFTDCYVTNYITAPEYTEYQSEYSAGAAFVDSYMQADEELDAAAYAWCGDYWEKDLDLADVRVKTSLGLDIEQRGYYEIETDNKFIFFNRTCTGFTVNDWGFDENDYIYDDCNNVITPNGKEKPIIALTGMTNNCKENKFITYNRTCTGKTVNNAEAYDAEYYEPYDVYKDIKNNAFGLRIDDEGRIGYRFGTIDCDNEHHYGVAEEYSKPGIVPADKWVTIDVRFKIMNPTYSQCFTNNGQSVKMVPNNVGKRKMRIYIYVDGYLKLISKELDEFNFRELDDDFRKQEGVPFSMSLGGGSQGLLETIDLNYYMTSEYCLPIERDFCGTFLGDIRSFKFFDCFVDAQTMRDSNQTKNIEL